MSQGGANHDHGHCRSHGHGRNCSRSCGTTRRHASTTRELTKAPSLSKAQCDHGARVIGQSNALGPKGNPSGALLVDPTTFTADVLVDEACIHLLA